LSNVHDDQRDNQFLRGQATVEELASSSGPEDGQASRHDDIEVAGHPACGKGDAHGGWVRDAAPSYEHAPLEGSRRTFGRINHPLRAEILAEGDEAMICADDNPFDADLGKTGDDAGEEISDSFEV
jgi:hypothetical protein